LLLSVIEAYTKLYRYAGFHSISSAFKVRECRVNGVDAESFSNCLALMYQSFFGSGLLHDTSNVNGGVMQVRGKGILVWFPFSRRLIYR
jgi:hypothetical protein